MNGSIASQEIREKNIELHRYLHNLWIFSELLRSLLEENSKELVNSDDNRKRTFRIPNGGKGVVGYRSSKELAALYMRQYKRGIFETNLISMVSRFESFIQECIAISVKKDPKKLSILSDKSGILLDLFLEYQDRDGVIDEFISIKCEGLLFGKPSEYLETAAKVLSIEIDPDLINSFIEIKATRDIIIHNNGRINKIYTGKSKAKSRGSVEERIVVDSDYFNYALVSLKKLAGSISRKFKEKHG